MKICNLCGQSIKDDSLFCPFCGGKVNTDEAVKEIDQTEGQTIQTETMQETAAAQEMAAEAAQQSLTPPEAQQQNDLARGQAAGNPYSAPQPVADTYASPNQQANNMYSGQASGQQANPYTAPQPAAAQQPYIQQPVPQANPYMAPQPVQPSYYAQAQANMQAYQAMNDKPLSVGQWMLTLLVLSIPTVNIIMIFIWAFSDGNTSRKNFCRASLIYGLIAVVLIILLMIFVVALASSASSGSNTVFY